MNVSMNGIDIVVLNYNDAKTTCDFVKRVRNYICIKKIVVVDNCSSDDSFSILNSLRSAKIDIIRTERNGGYGAGNNYGIKYLNNCSDSRYILLANPDTIIKENTIIQMVRFMNKHEEYAIVAPYMLNKDGLRTSHCAFRLPTKLEYVLSFGMIYSKFVHSFLYKSLVEKDDEILDVDAVSGALFMMNKKKMIEDGMYDENIFLYCEEVVLGMKMKKTNNKIGLMCRESFIHNHSQSISKTYSSVLSRQKLLIASKLYVIKKYYKAGPILYFIAVLVSHVSLFELRIKSLLGWSFL